MSQAQLAEAAGVAQPRISLAESGAEPLSLESCMRYATVLGCPPSALDPDLPDDLNGRPLRIITDPNDLPDDLEGDFDFIYESPDPYAKKKK